MNLRMLSYTRRPASTAATIVAKLSSVSTIVEASRATSVPDRPIAIPMSARRSAGASFTPSPVIATIWPSARSASAIRSFASGEVRANTSSLPWRSSLIELGVADAIELIAGQDASAVVSDADFAGDRRCGHGVIAR